MDDMRYSYSVTKNPLIRLKKHADNVARQMKMRQNVDNLARQQAEHVSKKMSRAKSYQKKVREMERESKAKRDYY